jgi:hypothetical protein
MRVRRPHAPASERLTAPACGMVLAAALLIAAAGCGSHAATQAGTAAKTKGPGVTACGTTRTAANVPVDIQIVRGQVSCATALAVEHDYAKAILSGKVPGNGGAPVHIQGWVCQGFTTPVVLRTGKASKCVQGGAEILAILPSPA